MKLTQPRIIQHWQKEFSHSSYSNYFTPVHQDVYAQKSAKSPVFCYQKMGLALCILSLMIFVIYL
ncbi:hypothetical protein [Helicobacter sp. 11S03491-1]|uniref:hypothetical protein n=1 Tax=Helicobacter sp. 11S03491-1 TaxID=1476196 RepID=UPI000BA50A1E|nr:hypothetical protein [Helicobacter sp. 11S03491-1]PAF41055.1 hypothetical protein BKH45_08485 [Helicobacter sp. 11S03491-1]